MRALVVCALLPIALVSAPGEADAPPRCDGRAATIVGTPHDDFLTGTRGPDVIVGGAGRDRITGGQGNDLICGGDGNDVLLGGAGDDRVYGQEAAIKFDHGGSKLVPNLVVGGPGDDFLDAGFDSRRTDQGGRWGRVSYRSSHQGVHLNLSGGGTGTVTGQGHDTVRVRSQVIYEASRHDDLLQGSAHDDYLVGDAGDDELHGGDGDDILETEADGLRGLDDDDLAYGDAGRDHIVTGRGRDVIHGGPDDDQIGTFSDLPTQVYGEDGDDQVVVTVTVEPGYLLDGGAGHDITYLVLPEGYRGRGATVVVDAGTGAVTRASVRTGTLLGADELYLDDSLTWVYYGTEGPDTVSGGSDHSFTASTYGGDDVVYGSFKDDVIDAGAGEDDVSGDEGTDLCLNAERRYSCETTG